ncbi:MAG: HU family DNA-binding protein [Chloroflexota bacterium]|nr:HU family DNA-binding protein [Chloroflexota bacterium]
MHHRTSNRRPPSRSRAVRRPSSGRYEGRNRLKNRDVQLMLETLVEVWTESLIAGERIEIENFAVIDVQTIERPANRLLPKRTFRQVTMHTSKALRMKLNASLD